MVVRLWDDAMPRPSKDHFQIDVLLFKEILQFQRK